MKARQSGITLLGFLFILMIFGFFAYMAMKLVPAYAEYMGVVKALKEVASEPGVVNKPLDQIKSDLSFKGDFQYVDSSTLSHARIRILTGNGKPKLSIQYERDIPFMYNIDFLLHFEKTVPMNAQSTGG